MNFKKTYLIFIFLIPITFVIAQDKIIYKNGTVSSCKLVSINKNTVTFNDSTSNSVPKTISKNELVLAEFANGAVYVFGEDKSTAEEIPQQNKNDKAKSKEEINTPNIVGLQLFGLLGGRGSFSYERLFNDEQLGILIPVVLTFNPYPDNSGGASNSLNFISGLDVNYYFDTKWRNTKFLVGPRVRYGSDVFINNMAGADITGLSLQAQNGFFITGPNKSVCHTLAFGFGFVRIINSGFGSGVDHKQSYPWMSLTYRFGIRW